MEPFKTNDLILNEKTVLDALYERYSDLMDLNGLNSFSLHYKGGSLTRTGFSTKMTPSNPDLDNQENKNNQSEPINESDIKISTNDSPRKPVFASMCVVLCGKGLNFAGDTKELETICRNVLELDISNNKFQDWNEIKNLISSMKKLRFLNLTSNPSLSHKNESELVADNEIDSEKKQDISKEKLNKTIEFFENEWPLVKPEIETPIITELNYDTLKTLVLNECFIDLKVIECLLERLTGLNELHLSRNKYNNITFSKLFTKPSLKILYVNKNNLNDWHNICKLGKCFPNLEHLVLSDNDLDNFSISENYKQCEHFEDYENLSNSDLFKCLNILNVNNIKLNSWSSLDQLRGFPNLKHIRIHNVPLLDGFKNDEEKHSMLVGHLDQTINLLNGSNITNEFKESCERKYLRYFMDHQEKPARYFELEKKHGKLDRLADVNLDKGKTVQVKIKFDDKHIFQKISVRQKVGEFKKSLEKFVGHPSNKFRLFYIDVEGEGQFGHDELKLNSSSLVMLNLKDGDEFDICLKPEPVKKKV